MNMHTKPPLTAAEQGLVDAYVDAVGRMPGDPELSQKRDRAIQTIKQIGLPTRRVESWHYTDLRTLLKSFNPVALRPEVRDAEEKAGSYKRLVDAIRLPMFDGHYFGELADSLPEGLSVSSFAGLAQDGEDLGAWKSELNEGDQIGLLNAGFFRDGLDVQVAAGAKVKKHIGVANIEVSDEPVFSATRHNVRVGDGASATFIERHVLRADSASQVCPVVNLDIAEGAEVTWLLVQEGGSASVHLGQIRVNLAKDAKFSLFIMNAGGSLVREEVYVDIAGEGADFQLRGINLLAGKGHTDITMVVDHDVPNTTSTEIVRNVVLDQAKGVFQGQIRVDREAQKTDARMACNTLLLSDDGSFSSKPELEIFADDVQCGHGATVAEIENEYLFYLMSRGISEKEARGLLVKAFVAEIIEELEDEALVEALEDKLGDWFVAHG